MLNFLLLLHVYSLNLYSNNDKNNFGDLGLKNALPNEECMFVQKNI